MTGFALAVVIALVALVVVVIASVLHYRSAIRRFAVDMDYALVERVDTPDGAHVELRRLPSRGVASAPPVLLVHGIAIDHRNNDMLPAASFARHLAARGRDVWLLTLRSGIERGPSGHASLVHFDRMVRHDVALGVAEVRARTGAAAIDYVGFSMGGMLFYAAIGVAGSVPWEHVRRVVILGSPGKLMAPFPGLAWIARVPRWLVPSLPLRVPSRMVAFMAEWITTPIHHLIYNPRNVERGAAGPALMTIQDVPRTLMGDFAGFLARGGEVTFEGSPILPGLARVTIPVRFFAGAADRLAPPEAVRAAFDAWGADAGSVDKAFTLLSKDTHTADYGHGDLAIGRGAVSDLYEPAEAFLDAP